RIASLVLPIPDHRLPPLRAMRFRYTNQLLSTRAVVSDIAVLGGAASLGFLLLLWICLARPRERRLPTHVRDAAGLNLAALLLGTTGGFGLLFATFVSPQIRCYDRLSIFIGFLGLFALLAYVDRWYRRCAQQRRFRAASVAALAGITLLGILD